MAHLNTIDVKVSVDLDLSHARRAVKRARRELDEVNRQLARVAEALETPGGELSRRKISLEVGDE
jgi:hypothetical protein